MEDYTQKQFSIVYMPIEIIYKIVGYISDPNSFKNLSIVCKLFALICSNKIIQRNAKESMKKLRKIKNNLIQEEYFICPNGTKFGEYKSYYDDGNLEILCYYDEDKLNGEYKKWHPNKTLCKQCSYIDDKIEGNFNSWFNNGNIQIFVRNNIMMFKFTIL